MTICINLHAQISSEKRTVYIHAGDLNVDNVEHYLSGLNVMVNHPDMLKIRIIGFFSEYRLHFQFEILLLLFTVCTCVKWGSVVVKALRYKSEGLGIDSRCRRDFSCGI